MFFAWNVRGLNNDRRHVMVKEWIRDHIPLFGAYLETHIQPSNSRRIVSAIPRDWQFFEISGQHPTARIVVVWDPSITVTIYQVSAQTVTCGIFILSESRSFTVTFAYGFNQVEQRTSLWEELVNINATTPVSRSLWMVVGDFNQSLRVSDHSNYLTHEIDTAGMDEAILAIQQSDLFEARSKGLPFTWRNCQDDNPISKKIDHVLVNEQWAVQFPDSFSEFIDPLQSDHAPCLVRMPSLQRKVVKQFKFFHHVIDHPRFLQSVKDAWNCEAIQGTLQFKIVRSFKLLKPVLRNLNKTNFSGITNMVKAQEAKLIALQRQLLTIPDPVTAHLEHEERQKWLTLKKAEEKFYRQKSRVKWHCFGDRDTSFYHRTAIHRNSRNHIHYLRDGNDNILTSPEGLKSHSDDYFEGILGSSQSSSSSVSVLNIQNLLPSAVRRISAETCRKRSQQRKLQQLSSLCRWIRARAQMDTLWSLLELLGALWVRILLLPLRNFSGMADYLRTSITQSLL